MCEGLLYGHEFAQIATCVVKSDEENSFVRFTDAYKQHDWELLKKLSSWKGTEDDLVVYAARCSGRLGIIVVYSFFELFLYDPIYFNEALSYEESERLIGTFPDLKWHPFWVP